MSQTTLTMDEVMSIVSFVQAGSTKLPNDIIMKIVKEADGGLTTHKKNILHKVSKKFQLSSLRSGVNTTRRIYTAVIPRMECGIPKKP